MPFMPAAPHRDARLPPRTRRVVHADVDAFLASVEVVTCPELRGKRLVIGGPPESRNLVMSSSYEARAFGVRPGMALSEARRRCPQAIFRDGDAQAANRVREAITRVLLGFTPRVEVASIDDFFLDLTGTARLHGAAFDAAERVRARVRDEVGVPLTIGIATNRVMARLAGKLAKPGGIAEILPGGEEAFLAGLPVDHLPGVGHSIGARLERFAIRTVGELRLVPREVLFASFGRNGLVLYERARGRDDEPVVPTHTEDAEGRLVVRPPRSLSRETSFEPEEGRRPLLESMLSYLVERAAHRLRAHGLVAGSRELRVRYVDTRPRMEPRTDHGAGRVARRRALPCPTDATDDIWRHAQALFAQLPRRRALVKNLGLTLHDLQGRGGWQGRLFDETDRGGEGESRADRQRRLDGVVDELRERLGFGRVLRGSSTPLSATHPLRPDGYRLRTPSLNQ
jgi:DNA polymerase-4